MKRCPQCYKTYDDEERFCEADGQELLADPSFIPRIEIVAAPAPAARAVWWPAAALGILVGVVIGAGIFAVGLLMSPQESNDRPAMTQAAEPREPIVTRPAVTSNSAPTPVAEESPSPDAEEQAEAAPSPVPETKTASVQLNQGPISTGEKKTKAGESESNVQTVIEMNDGSTLQVDAAWEDKQGVWYRRSGLVSFVDNSRVKAITTTRVEPTAADNPHR